MCNYTTGFDRRQVTRDLSPLQLLQGTWLSFLQEEATARRKFQSQ